MAKIIAITEETECYFRDILDACRKACKLTKKELIRSEEYLIFKELESGFSELIREIMMTHDNKPVDILISGTHNLNSFSYLRFRKEVKE